MCGLVGIAGKLSLKDEQVIKRMLLIAYLRGPDSTGLASIRGDTNTVTIAKACLNPIDFFDYKPFASACNGAASKVFLGHNRSATRGAINKINSHPFHIGKIVGAHNGTLDLTCVTDVEKELGQSFGTDSELIFACINEWGIEETIPKLHGAWSLTWMDTEENTINFIRNSERPMYLSFSEDKDRLLWASVWPIIQIATAAIDTKTVPYELHRDSKNFAFWPTDEDVWYRFNLADFKETKPGITLKKAVVKTLKGKEPPKAVVRVAPFNRERSWTPTGTNGSTVSTTVGKTIKETNMITMHGTLAKDPYAGLYHTNEQMLMSILDQGCGWCGIPLSEFSKGVTIFEKERKCLCNECGNAGNVGVHARILTTDFDKMV